MPFCFKCIKTSQGMTSSRKLLVLLLILWPAIVHGITSIPGDSTKKKTHWKVTEKGLLTGYGIGINQFSLPEGNYSPLFLMGQLGVQFPSLLGRIHSPGPVSLFFEPQFNLVLLRSPASVQSRYELGIGVGIQQVFNLSERVKPFIRLVVGPHYISTHSALQHTGFILSDNAAAGFYYYFSRTFALQAQFRARHMSNANLQLPNHGINTSNFMIGFSRFLY